MSQPRVGTESTAVPSPHWRAALGWLVIGCAVGIPLWATEPFGAATREHIGSGLNGITIGAAPIVAIWRAYAEARRTPLEPHGLAQSPVLGGRAFPVLGGLTALVLSVEFAWGTQRLSEAIAMWFFISTSWLIIFESQRRERRVSTIAAGDRPEPSSLLEVNIEGIAIGLYWCGCIVVLAFVAPGALRHDVLVAFGFLALGTSVAYAGTVIYLASRAKLVGLIAAALWIPVLPVMAKANGPAGSVYLVAVAALLPWPVERARRSARQAAQ